MDGDHPYSIDRTKGFTDYRVHEAEEFNELLESHLPSAVQEWDCDSTGWTFKLQDVMILVNNPDFGPLSVVATSSVVARKFLDGMRVQLRRLLNRSLEPYGSIADFAILLLQLVEEAISWVELWKDYNSNFERDTGLLKLSGLQLEEAEADKDDNFDYKDVQRWMARKRTLAMEPFKAQNVAGWYSILDNAAGLDISSVEDTTMHLLGKSIEEMCKDITQPQYLGGRVIDDDIRVLHVEPVFRADLVLRFLTRKEEIHQELSQMSYRDLRKSVDRKTIRPNSRDDTVEELANVLAQPTVTFHGASSSAMQSIVRYGFIIPGGTVGTTGKELNVQHGSSYGIGIYCTTDPHLAMDYSWCRYGTTGAERSGVYKARDTPGTRLFVCATLMGRAATVTRAETRRQAGLHVAAAHSHVSPDQSEYIVFDSAQIIPCYVLHLDKHPDMRQESIKQYEPARSRLNAAALRAVEDWEVPKKAAVEKKKALKAGAMKWFPYGFGTATGTNFVIEDMADVSEDEEIYGEFQHQRMEQGHEIREQYSAPDASWLDQYQTVRKTKADVFCSWKDG